MALVFQFCFLLIAQFVVLSVRYGNAKPDKCPEYFACGE